MWLSPKLIDILHVAKSHTDLISHELTKAQAERDVYKSEVTTLRVTNDWMRMKINQLELERADLMHRAYGVTLPVPELVRAPAQPLDPESFSFDDVGNEVARRLGLPIYDHQPPPGE